MREVRGERSLPAARKALTSSYCAGDESAFDDILRLSTGGGWKEYRHNHKEQTLKLTADEFIRRLCPEPIGNGVVPVLS